MFATNRLTAAVCLAAAVAVTACGPDGPTTEELCRARLPGDLVISEFMPDPDGVDTGKEWVELYNATGAEIDLRGMTLFLAKADGSDEKKYTIKSAKIPAGGYFVLGDAREEPFPTWINQSYGNSLGAMPNTGGVLGVRCGSKLLDEVRYTTTGTPGRSRALDGSLVPDSAVNDVEENWCDATASFDGTQFGTPGAPNGRCGGTSGTTCTDPDTGEPREVIAPEPGDLVITEVMPDPDGVSDADGEWFELIATSRVDLNGLKFTSGSGSSTVQSDTCVTLEAGSYGIVARKDDAAVNGGLPFVTATTSVSLVNSNGTLSVLAGETVLDSLTWTASQEGRSIQVSPTALDPDANDDPANLCPATQPYGTGTNLGTPGAANQCIGTSTCTDTMTGEPREIIPPQPGDLVITEVMPDPGAVPDSNGEWFELLATSRVDLNGLTFATGTNSVTLARNECVTLEAGAYGILARAEDPTVNGGLPFVTASLSVSLVNTNGTLSVLLGETVLDTVTWKSSQAGVAIQVSPTALDPDANDDPANLCAADQPYGSGGDKGTPGAANTACPVLPPPGQCIDQGTGMPRPVVPPVTGSLVITEVMADPAAVGDNVGEWFEVLVIQDADLNGLMITNEGSGVADITRAECLPVTAGSHLVFARNVDPGANGGLPAPVATFGFSIANTGTRSLALRHQDTDIDRISWSTPATSGASLQLSPAALDAVSNDDPANFCVTPPGTTYGAGDRGTPGLVNVACP